MRPRSTGQRRGFRRTSAILLLIGLVGLLMFFIGLVSYTYALYFGDQALLPCEQLPPREEAQQVLEQHKALAQCLERAVNYGEIKVMDSRCPRKGEIVIPFDSIKHRNQIRGLLGKNFFGVPYRMSGWFLRGRGGRANLFPYPSTISDYDWHRSSADILC